ncbi:MAG TPA: hypothetical protein VHC72_19880, partial [Bryobacteraceae bacterium]|nr:hypothetical protein [Bryobacteraceae bacterium]
MAVSALFARAAGRKGSVWREKFVSQRFPDAARMSHSFRLDEAASVSHSEVIKKSGGLLGQGKTVPNPRLR